MKKCIIGILCLLTVLCAGCGKNNKTEDTQSKLYISEETTSDEIVGSVSNTFKKGQCLYTAFTDYEKTYHEGRHSLFIYNYEEGSSEIICIDSPDLAVMEGLNIQEDGSFLGLFRRFDEESKEDTAYIVAHFSQEGELMNMKEYQLSKLPENIQNTHFYMVEVEENGLILMAFSTKDTKNRYNIYSFDEKGTCKIVYEGEKLSFNSILDTAAGTWVVESEDYENKVIYSLENHEKIASIQVQGNTYATDSLNEGHLSIFDGEYLYDYNLESKEKEKVFSYSDLNLKGGLLYSSYIYMTAMEEYYVLKSIGGSEADGFVYKWYRITPDVNSQEKEIITVAIKEENPIFSDLVMKFNEQHKDLKVVVKSYRDEGDKSSEQSLLLDITAGNIPDIISSDLCEWNILAQKGYIHDLSDFLEKDDRFSRENYIEGSLELYSVGEKVYALPRKFWIDAMVGKRENLTPFQTFNQDSFRDYVHSYSYGQQTFSGIPREIMLQFLLETHMEEYVNWENGTCSFDSDEFKALLEYANQYGRREQEDYYKMLVEDEILALPVSVSHFDEYQRMCNMLGTEVSFVSLPSEGERGFVMESIGTTYMMSENSRYKEEVWELLTEYSKATLMGENGFYAYAPLFDEMQSEAMEKNMVEQGGELVEEPKAKQMNSYLEECPLYAVTEEEMETIVTLIQLAHPVKAYSETIERMVMEETADYFSGAKDLEKTMQLIQEKVELYLSEIN